jgi:hypothetical protein
MLTLLTSLDLNALTDYPTREVEEEQSALDNGSPCW